MTFESASTQSARPRFQVQFLDNLYALIVAISRQVTSEQHVSGPVIDQHQAVQIWQVLAHRVQGADSRFSPYISNLPVGVPGIPMFFGREPLQAIQYAPVSQQVQMRCRWLLNFAQGALQPLPMLPLIVMCNHSFSPNCKLDPQKDKSLQLVALEHIPHQQPLVLSYGNLPNDFLLMDYGFVVANNPHDRVQLRFNLEMLEVSCSGSLYTLLNTQRGIHDLQVIRVWNIDTV